MRETQAPERAAGPPPTPRWLHRVILAAALVNLLGVIAGGGVTSTDSAIVDASWPSFEGRWLPNLERMFIDLGLFLEHYHRVLMWTTGALMIVIGVGVWRVERARPGVRRLGLGSLLLVIVIGGLGGATVLLGKSPAVSVVHVALAMLFVGALWSLVVLTGRRWFEPVESVDVARTRPLFITAVLVAIAVWLQIVLGAVPRHATAEVGGRTLVLIGDLVHFLWAFVVCGLVIVAYLEAARHWRKSPRIFRPAFGLVFLIVAQIFLGFVAFIEQPKDPPGESDLLAARAVLEERDAGSGRDGPGSGAASAASTDEAAASDGEGPVRRDISASHALSASAHQAAGVLLWIGAIVLCLRAARVHRVALAEAAGTPPASEAEPPARGAGDEAVREAETEAGTAT